MKLISETLWPLLCLISLTITFSANELSAQSSDVCSLILHLRSDKGESEFDPPIDVEIIDGGGNRFYGKYHNRPLKFCSIAIGEATVKVGEFCNVLTLSDIPIVWGQLNELNLTVNLCPSGTVFPPPAIACDVIIRVNDGRGNPVEGVPVSSLQHGTLLTSKYGRVFFRMPFRTKSLLMIGKSSEVSKQLEIKCESSIIILNETVTIP